MNKVINQKIDSPLLAGWDGELFIKREDQIHPFISGNKYRKLKYNLIAAKESGARLLLTFGGAYSNHLSALSYAGKKYGFETIGIVRGDELKENLDQVLQENQTLKFARENGMQFKFISRSDYRTKNSASFLRALKEEFGDFYLVPEGGTNDLAIKGCEEILNHEDHIFDYICVSVGTGGTISGLINSAADHQTVLGFPSLKGDFLNQEISWHTEAKKDWILMDEYHFGGYAKINEKLISFINQFYRQTNIPLDPVYTGKMMYGIFDLVQKNYFKEKSKILAIHTGGLQGIQGMNQRLIRMKLPVIDI